MKLTIERAKALMDKNSDWFDLSGTGITSLPEGLTVRKIHHPGSHRADQRTVWF